MYSNLVLIQSTKTFTDNPEFFSSDSCRALRTFLALTVPQNSIKKTFMSSGSFKIYQLTEATLNSVDLYRIFLHFKSQNPPIKEELH